MLQGLPNSQHRGMRLQPAALLFVVSPLHLPRRQHQPLSNEHFLRTRNLTLTSSVNRTGAPWSGHRDHPCSIAEEPERLEGWRALSHHAAPTCQPTPCPHASWVRAGRCPSFLASWSRLLTGTVSSAPSPGVLPLVQVPSPPASIYLPSYHSPCWLLYLNSQVLNLLHKI